MRQYLTRYLEGGRLELSNNRAERSIKPFVVGRKNWLSARHPQAPRQQWDFSAPGNIVRNAAQIVLKQRQEPQLIMFSVRGCDSSLC